MKKYLPVGIEDFKEMIDRNYYYVDKTRVILDTFSDKVALYTRPRRFGKTLNMSMLKYFYSVKEKQNSYLFDHLYISELEEARLHQNQYPVLSISLKSITDLTYQSALISFSLLIQEMVNDFPELLDSNILNATEKNILLEYRNGTQSPHLLGNALRFLSICLHKHYGAKTVILIDEYDVPLNYAYENNYYNEMVYFFRTFLGSALKTNDSLEKAVLTGCLRISRESIFTGLNNFSVYALTDLKASSAFGFTQDEVNSMYIDYGFENLLPIVRKWYDGYLFGRTEIYNPWSTLKYLSDLLIDPDSDPISYWANTSSNSIVIRYIENSSGQTKDDFEKLVNGESIVQQIKPDLTYREMENIENIYSFLLLTGYLKIVRQTGRNTYEMVIPNEEVKEIYIDHFNDYFQNLKNHVQDRLYPAMISGNAYELQNELNLLLKNSISYFDNSESFYHGFLVGVLSRFGWKVTSNKEAGEGRFDILIETEDTNDQLILIECKHSALKKDMKVDAQRGAKQISDKGYLEDPAFEAYEHKVAYGISFYKKGCYVINALQKIDREL